MRYFERLSAPWRWILPATGFHWLSRYSGAVLSSAASTKPEANYRAFRFTRPYLEDLVRVGLNRTADSHPYRLVSTRYAEELDAFAGGAR